MQVRSLPGLVLPRLPTNAPQRAVAPVPAQDERSQPSVPVPVNRRLQADTSDLGAQARQNQRYSYTRIDVDSSRASRALQTYFDIQTQDEQERSQQLFGIDTKA